MNSLLTARNIPVAGEYEIKNAEAMNILDSFGAGGLFTEYYAMDFKDDVILMGMLLSVVKQPRGKLMLLVAEGNSVSGPILQIGNTNSRYKFPVVR